MVRGQAVADTRKPYSGLSRSLVIAIDVGTTFSGVRMPQLASEIQTDAILLSRSPMLS